MVLAQSNIYEMTLCCNEGLRKLRLEARVVPLGGERVAWWETQECQSAPGSLGFPDL